MPFFAWQSSQSSEDQVMSEKHGYSILCQTEDVSQQGIVVVEVCRQW